MLIYKQNIQLEPENLVSSLAAFAHSVTKASCSFKTLMRYKRTKEVIEKGVL